MRLRLSLVLLGLVAGLNVAAGPVDGPVLTRAIIVYDEVPAADEFAVPGIQQALVFERLAAAAVTAPRAVVERLAADPRVLDVYDERRVQPLLYASVAQSGAADVHEPVEYPIAGGLTRTRPGVTGAAQTVAVIDTGVFEHLDLLGRVIHRNLEFQYAGEGVFGASEIDLFAEATGAWDLNDNWGHGTHVAGIVAGDGRGGQGRSQAGVAPGATVLSLKIADIHNGIVEDAGWERNALAALDYVARHADDPAFGPNGITISNNSWGMTPNDMIFGPPRHDLVTEAIQAASDAGVVMVFASGNAGPDTASPWIPEDAITVGAACVTDGRAGSGCRADQPGIASFSSTGPIVDLAAPGVLIVSAQTPASLVGPLGQTAGDYGSGANEVGNRALYTSASGTSMASPHVAGAVALLLQANGDLTPQQVQAVLVASADYEQVDGASGYDEAWGHGHLDVDEALRIVTDLAFGEDPLRLLTP